MDKKKNSLAMLAQVMAQMELERQAAEQHYKPQWGGVDPTDPAAVPTIYQPSGGK